MLLYPVLWLYALWRLTDTFAVILYLGMVAILGVYRLGVTDAYRRGYAQGQRDARR